MKQINDNKKQVNPNRDADSSAVLTEGAAGQERNIKKERTEAAFDGLKRRKSNLLRELPQLVLPGRRSVPAKFAIPFLILIPFIAVWLARYSETGQALGWCIRHFGAWMLESLLLMMLSLVVFAGSRSLCAAWSVTAVLTFVIGVVNHFKKKLNGTEFVYSDFAMAGKLKEIAGYTKGQLYVFPALILVPVLILLIALILAYVDSRLKKPQKLRIVSVPLAALLFALFFLSNIGNNWVQAIANGDTKSEVFVAEHGAALGLYFGYNNQKYFHPDENTEILQEIKTDMNEHREKPAEPELSDMVKPNVIFIMSESFFDVTGLPNVEFSEDPLPNFHRLGDEGTSGKFITNTYCGGTAYVELEVLTAICSQFLADGDTLPGLTPTTVYSGMPCITEVFLGYGYETTFLHSHNNELYNRDIIYPQLGFENVIFCDEFQNRETSGGYVSDMSLTKEILSRCKDKEAPQFIYAVSMENHQPYINKYEDLDIRLESEEISGASLRVLSEYTQGVHNADAALGALTDALSETDEPYMVVFFGDHRPNLQVESRTVYSSLGFSTADDTVNWTTEELANMLSVDYLIWTNYEENLPEEQKNDDFESCIFLGLDILKRLGFTLSDYFAWLSRVVEPNMLVYRPRLFIDAEDRLYSQIPAEKKVCMDGYEAIVQNIVYGENDIISHNVNRIQAIRPENPKLVAHAGGAIYGYRLTDSIEALNNSYENGFRYFELDFAFTSDRHLVCIHDWNSMGKRMLGYEGQRTYSEFRSNAVLANLTLMDISDLVAWLEEHPECYIITDGKTENEAVLKTIHDKSGKLRNRFIPQIYSFDEYKLAQKYGFTNIILTLYQRGSSSGVVEFARENELWAVTIPDALLTEELLEGLNGLGVASYTHSVNDLSYYEQWRELGLTGIYTDYFQPSHWVE